MISQLLRDIARGFGRSIGWKLGALALVGALALFGMGEAKADTHTTQAQSAQHCHAVGAAKVAYKSNPDREATAYTCGHVPMQGGNPGYYQCATTIVVKGQPSNVQWDGNGTCEVNVWNAGTSGSGLDRHVYTSACPVGTVVNSQTGTCDPACDGKPPLSGNQWFQPAQQPGGGQINASYTQVCSDGCMYERPENAFEICKTVDGVEYCSASGFEVAEDLENGGACSYSSGFGSPPSDGDGDGTSDGNDGSPNNPGSTGGGAGEDSGGKDNNNDGDEGDEGEGSGNGNTSGGGGDCSTAPSSNGDAILAQIAFQTWSTRCEIERANKKSGTGTGTGGGTTGTPTDGTTSAGGADCSAPPIVTGDNAVAMVANQAWATKCAVEAGNAVSVTGDIGDCKSAFTVTGTDANAVKLRGMRAEICATERVGDFLESGGAVTVTGDIGDCKSPWAVAGTHANAATLRAMRAEICGTDKIVDALTGTDGEVAETDEGEGPGDAFGENVEVGGDGLDAGGLGFSRSCPDLPSITVYNTVIDLDGNGMLCMWMQIGGQFVLVLAALASMRLMASGGA